MQIAITLYCLGNNDKKKAPDVPHPQYFLSVIGWIWRCGTCGHGAHCVCDTDRHGHFLSIIILPPGEQLPGVEPDLPSALLTPASSSMSGTDQTHTCPPSGGGGGSRASRTRVKIASGDGKESVIAFTCVRPGSPGWGVQGGGVALIQLLRRGQPF